MPIAANTLAIGANGFAKDAKHYSSARSASFTQ